MFWASLKNFWLENFYKFFDHFLWSQHMLNQKKNSPDKSQHSEHFWNIFGLKIFKSVLTILVGQKMRNQKKFPLINLNVRAFLKILAWKFSQLFFIIFCGTKTYVTQKNFPDKSQCSENFQKFLVPKFSQVFWPFCVGPNHV